MMNDRTDKKLQAENETPNTFLFRWHDFWRAICKFWWVCIVLMIAFAGSMLLYCVKTYKPMYRASLTFTVSTANISSSGTGISSYAYNFSNSTVDQMSTLFPLILQSNLMRETICEDLQTDSLPASISTHCVEGSNMFTVYATGSDPKTAYTVLQAALRNFSLVSEYIIGKTNITMLSDSGIPNAPFNQVQYRDRTLRAALLGLLFGLAWILLYVLLRNTIRNSQDVRQYLNSDCIGTLPWVSFRNHKIEIDRTILITNPLVGNEFLESVRSLRNDVAHSLGDANKVVMITSTAAGEGKTTTAANLAVALAGLDKKVLLIDADIRNPSVNAFFGITVAPEQDEDYQINTLKEYGIDILNFSSDKQKLWKIINVDFLNALLQKYRNLYDCIIIDTAPAGLTSDPQILAEVSDGLIYVIREDLVRANKIRSTMAGVLTGDAQLLGCVISKTSAGMSGYRKNGKYGYYDRYYRDEASR